MKNKINTLISTICDKAITASRELALLDTRQKNKILHAMADGIEAHAARILTANRKDVLEATSAGLAEPMVKRLELNTSKIKAMAAGLRSVAALKDPVGRELRKWKRPNGLVIVKKSVPIGVICVIFESRPNVAADSAGLCFKSGNAVILRGGKEALRSNAEIIQAMLSYGIRQGLPKYALQLIRTADRAAISELVQMQGKIDLVMPRGGEALIRAVAENAKVPVIKHYKGVCHIFVDKSAKTDQAIEIIINAKCQSPAVCNSVEKVLIHRDLAKRFIPALYSRLDKLGVELRGDAASRKIEPGIKKASKEDWDMEYLDLTLTIGVVDSPEQAVAHINLHGSHHSDAIISENKASQKLFLAQVDSAVVYVNSSTRFTDGGEFGMGAEIGISTDKLHARGPMGLEELTTYKYLVQGKGQVRR